MGGFANPAAWFESPAVAELAASADVVVPGLGALVGELAGLAAGVTGPQAAQMSFDELEQQVMVRGRELLADVGDAIRFVSLGSFAASSRAAVSSLAVGPRAASPSMAARPRCPS